MGVFDLFSKRQKRLRGDVPDVYTYDAIPNPLRVQVVRIWKNVLGDENQYERTSFQTRGAYKFIAETLRQEYGVFQLSDVLPGSRFEYMEDLFKFFLAETNVEKTLDVIELTFRWIDRMTRKYDYLGRQNASKIADDAISELNIRFREHGVGYQYEEGEIIRVDSQLLHKEAVQPAISLLAAKEYCGAQDEFLKAYDHFRHGNHKEAVNEALKAFESTMKTICEKKGWGYNSSDTSKKLLDICFQNNLVPRFWRQHMSALRSLLEGGVPTGRNRLSSHGQGQAPIIVPDHIAAYVLHMTASAIVFLVKSEQTMA